MVRIEKVLSTISFNREEIRPSKEVLVQNAHVTSRILGYSPSCLNVKEALEMLIKVWQNSSHFEELMMGLTNC